MAAKRKTKPKPEYERFETYYEGESGAPWIAFCQAREADGWELEYAKVTKQIDATHFRGLVRFRRALGGES